MTNFAILEKSWFCNGLRIIKLGAEAETEAQADAECHKAEAECDKSTISGRKGLPILRREKSFCKIFREVFRSFCEVFQSFRKFFEVFASFSRLSDPFGPIGMHSDAFGSNWKRLDVFEKF